MLEISRFGLYALLQPKNMRKRLVCIRSHRIVFRPQYVLSGESDNHRGKRVLRGHWRQGRQHKRGGAMKGGPYIIEREFFRELREENGYYVDKTFFIEQFLLDPAHPQRSREQGTTTVFLRPRRFGKTMFLTMLDSFFNIRKDNRKLFEGLAVSANRELCEKWMNRYPVIYLNLQNAQGDDFADALTSLGFAITDVLREPKKLSGTSAEYKEAFRKIAYRKADRDLLQKSLRLLTAALAEHYQKPVILLIDEADVPVAKGAEFGYYEEMDEFMRGFYRETLGDNPALQFAFLLGRMRMTGEEVLCSGAAKAETYGLEDRKYSDLFGFTEEELDRLLQETGYVDAKEDIREWYGGYHLGGGSENLLSLEPYALFGRSAI